MVEILISDTEERQKNNLFSYDYHKHFNNTIHQPKYLQQK